MRKLLRGLVFAVSMGILLTGCSTLSQSEETTGELGEEKQQYSKANTFIQLASAYLKLGNYTAALSNARKAVKADKHNPNAYTVLGVVHGTLGEVDLAEQNYRKAISLDSRNPYALNAYGRLLCTQEKYDESLEYFRRSVANPLYETPWIPLTNAGICARSSSSPAQAEGLFRQALEANGRYPIALFQMARISFEQDNMLSARAYIDRYREVAESTAEVLWLGIQIERQLNDLDRARSYELQLRDRFPDSEEVQKLGYNF
jgi:type IV pilus assembly protein PilF